MLKLMKHKDEDSNAQGERITVADVIKGSDAYFSLADFVKVSVVMSLLLFISVRLFNPVCTV